MPVDHVSTDLLHHDQLPAELQERFAGAFDAHFNDAGNLPEGYAAAPNYADLLAKSKIALAAVSTAYASVGLFVPEQYNQIIKIALAVATAGINAIPTPAN